MCPLCHHDPALRAALDIAAAPPETRAEVAATMQKSYGVLVARSDNPLAPALFLPTIVPVPVQREQQLRAAARHG